MLSNSFKRGGQKYRLENLDQILVRFKVEHSGSIPYLSSLSYSISTQAADRYCQ